MAIRASTAMAIGETLTEAAPPAGLSGQPLYQQIAGDLRSRITGQEFAAGSYLPTEEKLCAHYQVSRFTIREALRQLQQEGLISRRRGAGTLIRHDGIRHDGAATPQAAPDDAAAATTMADSLQPGRFGGSTTLVADERLSQRLGCAAGSRWLVRSAVYAAPAALVEIYLSETLRSLAGQATPGQEPLWEQLERLGQPLGRVQVKVQSVTPNQSEARLLNVAALAPCLRITTLCHDLAGELLACATHLHPGHSFVYETDIPPGKAAYWRHQ